ncbi:MAG TPA: hypothetical protein VMT91_03310 [Anaerolineales bacterium]|nr:hypothetical protein [Anaerolineales bacterium]
MQKIDRMVASITLLVMFLAACGPLVGSLSNQAGTQTGISAEVMETVTARSRQQGSAGQFLETALANTTEIAETTTAQVMQDKAAYQATSTAIVPVLEELPTYGVGPLQGDVAWLHKPVTINLNGYQQFGYANDYPQTTARDFVLAADITWNTQFGSSGCGFMFRSDADRKSPSQFMMVLTRFAYGTLIFSAMVNGSITNMQIYYPWTKDKSFNWFNDATNRLVVVARGQLIDIFTNGVLVAELDTTREPPSTLQLPVMPTPAFNSSSSQLQAYQQAAEQNQQITNQLAEELLQAQQNYNKNKVASLRDGFLGFLGMSTAGSAVCKFSDAWLFILRLQSTATPPFTPVGAGTPSAGTPSLTPAPAYTITP